MATIKARLNLRTDTAAAWVSANPVLLAGEIAFESDTKKVRVGDGITSYTALPFVTLLATAPDPLLKSGGAMTGLITGTAVQSVPWDQAAGRILTVGAFGLGANYAITTTDWNTATVNGAIYMGNTAENGPESGWFIGTYYRHNSTYGAQVVRTMTTTTINAYQRNQVAGVWSAWTRLDAGSIPQLSQAQAENPASTVFGQVSGQLMAQAVAAYAMPKAATGTGLPGQFLPIAATTSAALVLPASGTWAYFYTRYLSSGFEASSAGIDAGGATVGVAIASRFYVGWAWRIS